MPFGDKMKDYNKANTDILRSHLHWVKMGKEAMNFDYYVEMMEAFLEDNDKDDIIKALEYDLDRANEDCDRLEQDNEWLEDDIYNLEDKIKRLEEALDEAKLKGFI